MLYVDDYSPPDYEKAEPLYYEFLEKYSESPLRGFVDETLGKSYYRDAEWNKLLRLCTPAVKEYIEKGKRPRPALIFMYSEANFHMGNWVEAEKGYKIVIKLFPKLKESMKAEAMLKVIKKKKSRAD